MPRIPNSPLMLVPRAKKEWKRVLPLLMEGRELGAEELALLSTYCNAVAMYERALAVVAEKGHSYESRSANGAVKVMQRPEVLTMNQNQRIMADMSKRFGLTPLDKQRLPEPVTEPEADRPNLRDILAGAQ